MKVIIEIEALERYARWLAKERAACELMTDPEKLTGACALDAVIHVFKNELLDSVRLQLEDDE